MKNDDLPDGGSLLGALAAWILCAPVLLLLAALIANTTGMGERGIAYLSSFVSFACAAAAGFAAAKRRKKRDLMTLMLSATALVIVLLTVGFLIEKEAMAPSSILSLVSFTYAGALVGGILLYNPGKARTKQSFYARN